MTNRWLVLRPQPGADETVAVLHDAGVNAEACPVLGRRELPEDASMRMIIQGLAEFRWLIFVSPAAVEFGMNLIDRYWPQLPITVGWIAVGERTRQALAGWGVAAVSPPAELEHSEGLLALPEMECIAEEKILILRGRGGRELLGQALSARGARVTFLELYERVPLPVVFPAAEDVAGLVVSSVAVLDGLLSSGGIALRERPVIVPSQRVAEAARQAGFAEVCCAGAAGPAATLAAIMSLAEGARH